VTHDKYSIREATDVSSDDPIVIAEGREKAAALWLQVAAEATDPDDASAAWDSADFALCSAAVFRFDAETGSDWADRVAFERTDRLNRQCLALSLFERNAYLLDLERFTESDSLLDLARFTESDSLLGDWNAAPSDYDRVFGEALTGAPDHQIIWITAPKRPTLAQRLGRFLRWGGLAGIKAGFLVASVIWALSAVLRAATFVAG
jgi:hypothetical protein